MPIDIADVKAGIQAGRLFVQIKDDHILLGDFMTGETVKISDVEVTPIVRCAVCSWGKDDGFCPKHGHPVSKDFFCAHGTTGDVRSIRQPAPAKKKPTGEVCGATGKPCSRCVPGPCDHRRTVTSDDAGQ